MDVINLQKKIQEKDITHLKEKIAEFDSLYEIKEKLHESIKNKKITVPLDKLIEFYENKGQLKVTLKLMKDSLELLEKQQENDKS